MLLTFTRTKTGDDMTGYGTKDKHWFGLVLIMIMMMFPIVYESNGPRKATP